MTHRREWDIRFMRMVYNEIAQWSKDPNKQVGALLVSPDKRQWSAGYNGFPRGCDYINGDKNQYTIHAELNAILNAVVDIRYWSLYVTEAPCLDCALVIVQKQIKTVVCPRIRVGSSWYDSQNLAIALLTANKIHVTFIDKDEVCQ